MKIVAIFLALLTIVAGSRESYKAEPAKVVDVNVAKVLSQDFMKISNHINKFLKSWRFNARRPINNVPETF